MIPETGLEEKALQAVRSKEMLAGGERLVVSVSGGPDSVSLLLFLDRLAPEYDLKLHVFHLDHMFRGEESTRDADFVEGLSGRFGIPCKRVAVDVPSLVKGVGASSQGVARRVRYEHLTRYADEVRADRIAMGHTADDQIETFLMRVIQGAGLTGLGGIPAVSGRIIRPLIGVWRAEVEEYCQRNGIVPRVDPSNLETVYLRNRIRLQLVPFMIEAYGPGIKEVILREVESLAADREFVRERVEAAFGRVAVTGEGQVRLSSDGLEGLHISMQRGVLREAWRRLGVVDTNLSWQHLKDVMDKVVGGDTGARLDMPMSVVVEREYDSIVFKLSRGDEKVSFHATLDVPGTVELPGGLFITTDRQRREEVEFTDDPDVEFIHPDVDLPLEVRSPSPGDRFHPLGAPGKRKLSDFFTDIKLARRKRVQCPVVLSSGDIVWVVGHRLDERYKVKQTDSAAIRLRLVRSREYHEREKGEENGGEK